MSKQMTKQVGNYEPNAQIVAWWKENKLTMAAIAKRSGFHEGTISKYFAGIYPSAPVEIERALLDIIDADTRKQSWDEVFFKTECSESTFATLDLIRTSCDIGLITGAAGLGKSISSRKYAEGNKSSIFMQLSEGLGDNHSIIRKLFNALDIRDWTRKKGDISRGEFLANRLQGAERLIVIDNAQRATISGLRWLFDFSDMTGSPIALIGNPEVLKKIADSDQLHSRIGIRVDVGGSNQRDLAWLDDAAVTLLNTMWPGHPKEIQIIAQETAKQPGHLRRLVKQIRSGIRLSQSPRWSGKPAAAFIQARTLIGSSSEE